MMIHSKKYLLVTASLLSIFLIGCTPPTDTQPTPSENPGTAGTTTTGPVPPLPTFEDESDAMIPKPPFSTSTSLGSRVVINDFEEPGLITSPAKITGAVPASWVFEGIFPLELRTDRGVVIKEWYGEANIFKDDGTIKTGLVPFTTTIEFETPTPEESETGVLRLMSDNSGDEPESGRDMVDIMVLFE